MMDRASSTGPSWSYVLVRDFADWKSAPTGQAWRSLDPNRDA